MRVWTGRRGAYRDYACHSLKHKIVCCSQLYHVVLCLHLKRSSSSFIQLWGFFLGLLLSVCAVNVSVPTAGRL
jgi:hypothetical protein